MRIKSPIFGAIFRDWGPGFPVCPLLPWKGERRHSKQRNTQAYQTPLKITLDLDHFKLKINLFFFCRFSNLHLHTKLFYGLPYFINQPKTMNKKWLIFIPFFLPFFVFFVDLRSRISELFQILEAQKYIIAKMQNFSDLGPLN